MTIGYELEFLRADLRKLSKNYQLPLFNKYDIVSYDSFLLKQEFDVTEQMKGGELISPVYNKKEVMLQELKEKLQMLKESKAYIPENSDGVGFHINLGNQFFDNHEKFEVLLKLLFSFQEEIFDLAKGEHEQIRSNACEDARQLDYNFVKYCIQYYSYLPYLGQLHCIRFKADVFELRYFNSSLNYEILKLFLEFSLHLEHYIRCANYDYDLIHYYFEKGRDSKIASKKERKNVLCRLLDFEY